MEKQVVTALGRQIFAYDCRTPAEETKAMAQALMADKSLSIKQICERLGIAKSTLYKNAGNAIRRP